MDESAESVEAMSADDAMSDSSSDMVMEEETVDLSGFVATEEMLALQEVVDEAFGGLCDEIKIVFPALTDDILEALKATILDTIAQQGDTFETQYDRAMAASGINPGTQGTIMRQGKTLTTAAVGLIILMFVVFFYTPLVAKLGVPRLIIAMFYVVL